MIAEPKKVPYEPMLQWSKTLLFFDRFRVIVTV